MKHGHPDTLYKSFTNYSNVLNIIQSFFYLLGHWHITSTPIPNISIFSFLHKKKRAMTIYLLRIDYRSHTHCITFICIWKDYWTYLSTVWATIVAFYIFDILFLILSTPSNLKISYKSGVCDLVVTATRITVLISATFPL